MWNLQTSVEKLKSCSSQTAHRVQSSKMARLLHKPNCGRSLVSILFTSNVYLRGSSLVSVLFTSDVSLRELTL